MAVYTLENLLEDVAARARPSGLGQVQAQRQQLAEVWAAVDRYASFCMEQRRGVVLPNLFRAGWQAVKLRGKATYRPYFQVADSFCRSYGAAPPRNVSFMHDEDICPMEDFNFSKAAIRFSSKLTKDQVAVGLRALVQQLGQVVGQSRPVSIELSFGKIVSEEREVRMVFAAELYAAQGLEVPSGSAGDACEGRGSQRSRATFTAAGPGREALQGLSLVGTGAIEAASGSRCVPLGSYSGPATASGAGGSCGSTAGTPRSGEEPDLAREPGPQAAARVRPPQSQRSHLLQSAHDDALHRQITALETRASEAMRDRVELSGQMYRNVAEDARRQAENQAVRREHAEFLQGQMEAKRNRAQAEKDFSRVEEAAPQKPPQAPRLDVAALHRRDMLTSQAKETHALEISAARAATEAPAMVGGAGGAGGAGTGTSSPSAATSVGGSHRRARSELREALDEQVQASRVRRAAMQQFDRRVEASMLAAESRELAVRREEEQAARARERQMLGAAWREEVKIRDIKKAIEAIEVGKHVPGLKAELPGGLSTAALATPRRPAPWGAGPESRPGTARGDGSGAASSRALSSARGSSEAAPLSARGEALGAAAQLALQRKAAAAA